MFAALLKGEVVEKSNLLLVAPKCLQNRVLEMIDEEIAHAKQGEESYIGIKINSLTDKAIITKLVASVVIPLLPIHVYGIFAKLTYAGTIVELMTV